MSFKTDLIEVIKKHKKDISMKMQAEHLAEYLERDLTNLEILSLYNEGFRE